MKTTHTSTRGVTLIDTIVGTALMLIVFVGVAAAFKLSVDVVSNNKARAGAIALANERMEYLRSLAYGQVGTVGGIPAGIVAPTETIALNGVLYTRRTYIAYVDDPADGSGASDSNAITADYKTAKIEVSWQRRATPREIQLVTRIEPLNGMEIACAPPCGTLLINAVDSLGQSLSNAQINIVNAGAGVNLTTFTNASGTAMLVGAPAASGYAVSVSRTGYSTAQTYSASAANSNPNPAHLTVSDSQTTSSTFGIDLVGTKTIRTFTQVATDTWSDPFSNQSLIATTSNTVVTGGSLQLEGSAPYPAQGAVQSVAIAPSYLEEWKSFSWTQTKPAGTNITYRVYDSTGGTLIPDGQLAGNSAGFTDTPIDLSGIPTSTYPSIQIQANLQSDTASTPSIEAWSVAYEYGPMPLPNLVLTLRGTKTIGSGPGGTLYKYSANHNSGAGGSVTVSNLEWDTYMTSVSGTSTGYTIASSCAPQPETLSAGIHQISNLYFAPYTTHSLLVDVRSAATGALVSNASVQLRRTGFDTTVSSDACGQSYFGTLSSATYRVTVTAPGYATYDNLSVPVSGQSLHSVPLN